MRKPILWAAVCGLMAISLMIAACGPAATTTSVTATAPTTTASTTTASTTTATTAPTTITSSEAPQYGGVINWYLAQDLTSFDEVIGWQAPAYTIGMTNGELLTGDWTRGPAGTGVIPALGQSNNRYDYKMGNLAESWEMPEVGHWIFHIRHGVHYSLNKVPTADPSRLVNGREFTATDAAFSLNLYITVPTSYIYRTFPGMRAGAPGVSINATDKYTLEIKVPVDQALNAINMFGDFASCDIPKEVIDKYGNGALANWKNSVGTGAFMLTDYVAGSLAFLVKNPAFWEKDPVGPGKGNQLPYVDRVRVMIIPDLSTLEAALRTGKIDFMNLISPDDGPGLLKTAPQLIYLRAPTANIAVVGMNTTKPPFSDIRVRRALNMAIDWDYLNRTLTKGTGLKMVYPGTSEAAYSDTFLPFDQAPPDVQAIYTYNPDKAKELLKEAGYPNGFKTSVVVSSVARYIDNMSILKDQWAKIGVDLSLDVKDTGSFASIGINRSYDQMMLLTSAGSGSTMLQGSRFQGQGTVNISFVNDATVNAAMTKVASLALTDPPASMKAFKDLLPYVYSQAWFISFQDNSPTYSMWWPWLKNFYGDQSIGWFDSNFTYYAWIDQNLKKSLGH